MSFFQSIVYSAHDAIFQILLTECGYNHHVWHHNNLCDITINNTDGWHGNKMVDMEITFLLNVSDSWCDSRPIKNKTSSRDSHYHYILNFFQILALVSLNYIVYNVISGV